MNRTKIFEIQGKGYICLNRYVECSLLSMSVTAVNFFFYFFTLFLPLIPEAQSLAKGKLTTGP